MDELSGRRLPTPRFSGNQYWDVGVREQLCLRTQPAGSRTSRDEVQILSDSLDFWLIHIEYLAEKVGLDLWVAQRFTAAMTEFSRRL
jgi:hypothetical protein